LFIEHGLKVTEQSKYIVRYESNDLIISLIHNPREHSNTLWIGRKNFNEVEIDNQIMRDYFSSDLKLGNLPQGAFVKNVFLFFMGDGKKLLERSEHAFICLEKLTDKGAKEYTTKLVEKQNLEAANKAWTDGNYSDVVKYLENINKDDLPRSFRKKYKIAQQRSNK
jgi:hypothetical protein